VAARNKRKSRRLTKSPGTWPTDKGESTVSERQYITSPTPDENLVP